MKKIYILNLSIELYILQILIIYKFIYRNYAAVSKNYFGWSIKKCLNFWKMEKKNFIKKVIILQF
jgi:uncharacterized integral membrane protein